VRSCNSHSHQVARQRACRSVCLPRSRDCRLCLHRVRQLRDRGGVCNNAAVGGSARTTQPSRVLRTISAAYSAGSVSSAPAFATLSQDEFINAMASPASPGDAAGGSGDAERLDGRSAGDTAAAAVVHAAPGMSRLFMSAPARVGSQTSGAHPGAPSAAPPLGTIREEDVATGCAGDGQGQAAVSPTFSPGATTPSAAAATAGTMAATVTLAPAGAGGVNVAALHAWGAGVPASLGVPTGAGRVASDGALARLTASAPAGVAPAVLAAWGRPAAQTTADTAAVLSQWGTSRSPAPAPAPVYGGQAVPLTASVAGFSPPAVGPSPLPAAPAVAAWAGAHGVSGGTGGAVAPGTMSPVRLAAGTPPGGAPVSTGWPGTPWAAGAAASSAGGTLYIAILMVREGGRTRGGGGGWLRVLACVACSAMAVGRARVRAAILGFVIAPVTCRLRCDWGRRCCCLVQRNLAPATRQRLPVLSCAAPATH
jgi:hypothetical protein